MPFDVAVIGAGPAGAVTASVLARRGRSVALIDTGEAPSRKVGEALPGAARPLLQSLGLVGVVESGAHAATYGNTSAWGEDEIVATDFIADPNGLGWHLDRARFDMDLREAACTAGATWRKGWVRSVALDGDNWSVKLVEGELQARWIVDATGRGATVARRHGAERLRDDDLVAVYAWLESPESDADTRTLIESTPDGWWYTAKLPDATRVVALHIGSEGAAELLETPGAWETLLRRTRHVGSVVKGAALLTSPRATEACGARLDHFFGDGWLAVGDAALSFDPLSSQGIYNALYAGMKAGQTLDEVLSGDLHALPAYAQRLEQIRSVYLARHRLYYEVEARWRDRPFWRRRRAFGVSDPVLYP